MKKMNIVQKNKDFSKIIENNTYFKDKNLVIYFYFNKLEHNRFGISVGTKIGNAIIRNKYKRKLRNIVDNNKKLYSKGIDYIIILRKNSLNLTFEEIEISFINLINKINSKISEGAKNEKE
ncbi:MAG: ribonuclease P protein component [Bacilli bacterium]